ncbi:chromosome segregation protein SMC [Candidatus Woesearchaeota archaeon]|nr:chromosome segregation protein SMC [Candidatus Woesearchaeota archaeon]
MTYIKKMKMHGFKSFAKPIDLPFSKDFSAVIGPNGSGKSNVVDSLCFVLGRLSSKSMRAENSAKLIYNGGKKGNPAKEAYVSILFDNESGSFPAKAKEIEIKRLVRHNGQSKYFINGELRTRQQIIDLLAAAKINPDGHNIILQGDIVHAAEMPSEERREIIEEISGISVYEDKKEKAVRELDKVESQLKEVSIVLAERGTYLKELKKDYEQASRYKELEKNINRNKATFLNVQVKQKEDKLNQVTNSINKNQDQINSINEKVSQFQNELKEKQQELGELNSSLEKSGEASQQALHKDIESLKDSLREDITRLSTLQNEVKSLNERKSQLQFSLQDSDKKVQDFHKKNSQLKEEIEKLEKQKAKKEQDLSKIKEKYNFDDFESSLAEIDSKIDEISKGSFDEKRLELLREKDKIELRLSVIEKLASKQQLSNLDGLKKKFKQAAENLSKSSDEDSTILNQLSSARIKLQQIMEEHARLKTRQSMAKESSFNQSVNKIKSLNVQGVYGTFAELAQVPSQYSLAIEVAAGSRLNSIIVKDDEIAAKCIQYLKKNKFGTAIFLPLNKLKTSPPLKVKEGYDLAIDLIKFDNKFSSAFSYVLGSTVIVDNIEAARKIGIGKHRMVTLDGDLVEQSGAMIGGFRTKRSSTFLTPDIDKNISSLSSEITRLKSLIQTLDKRLAENEGKISKAREEKSTFEGEILKIQASVGDIENVYKEKQELSQKFKQLNSELNELASNISKSLKILNELKNKRSDLREKIGKKRNPKIMEEIESLEKEIQGLSEKKIMLKSEMNNLSSQISELIMPEKESMSRIIKQNLSQLEQFNAEIRQLDAIVKDRSKEIKEKEKQELELYSNFKGMLGKREKLNEFIQKQEIKINNEQNKTQIFYERINNFSIDKAKVISEIQGLRMEFQEFKEVPLRKGLTEAQLKDEITKFESMMKNMGNVNLRALEIYEEVGKEYYLLEQKSEKLGSEKQDVMKMIEEVESKKTGVFMKTFNEINKNFEGIFSQLTTKGTAHLVLENPEKPLEGGIQVMVKIANNKYLDIKSLSGGEKTLTALSFIFSIQEHEPAPFYLLDEVDAALDKKNSEKLSELIKKYSEKAQYIVITHNDSVISKADKLYGVSMHKDGMSHVVSLKV